MPNVLVSAGGRALPALFAAFAGAAVVAVAALAADRPIEVAGDRVDYSAGDGAAVFSGNVVIQAGGLSARAQRLSVRRGADGNDYIAAGEPLSLFCDDCGADVVSGRIGETAEYAAADKRLRLRGGVSLCAGDGCGRGELRADSADWRRNEDIVVLRGAPKVTLRWLIDGATSPIIAGAAEMRYRPSTGDIVLTGGAEIRRGDDKIAGETIRLNVNTGALAAEAATKGRVKAIFQ